MSEFSTFNGYEVCDESARKDISYLKNYVTPQMFGAVGDGITDDTEAIQSAIDEANDKHINYVFFPYGKYITSSVIKLPSNIHLNLGGSTIESHNTNKSARILENKNYGSSRDCNIIIENGVLQSLATDNDVTDQGSGISFWMTKNTIIRNLETNHTYGDGLSFRDCENCVIENITINEFGRNGISPQAGTFVFNNVTVNGPILKGANPGVDIDYENNLVTEKTKSIFNNVKCRFISFVDFHSLEGDDFAHEITFNGLDVNTSYWGISIQATNKVVAKHFIINDSVKINNTSLTGGTGIRIVNVDGIIVDGCSISYDDFTITNSSAIIGNFDKCVFRNLDLSNFTGGFGIFAYGENITNCIFTNVKTKIYGESIENNVFNGCEILSLVNTSLLNNIFSSDSKYPVIEDNTNNIFGNSNGVSQSNLIISNEYVLGDITDGKDISIPIPLKNENGHTYLLSVGYSHKGLLSYSGYGLYSIIIGSDSTSCNKIFSIGERELTISANYTDRTITVNLPANFTGNFSYTLLG